MGTEGKGRGGNEVWMRGGKAEHAEHAQVGRHQAKNVFWVIMTVFLFILTVLFYLFLFLLIFNGARWGGSTGAKKWSEHSLQTTKRQLKTQQAKPSAGCT